MGTPTSQVIPSLLNVLLVGLLFWFIFAVLFVSQLKVRSLPWCHV
jgi:hypothetical protein